MNTKIRKKGRNSSYAGLLCWMLKGKNMVIRYKSNNGKLPYKGLNSFKNKKDFLTPFLTLNDKYKWSEEFINFVKSCLVKDHKYLKIIKIFFWF